MSVVAETPAPSTCRMDRIGDREPASFGRVACVFCYPFVWPEGRSFRIVPPLFETMYVLNGSEIVTPDPSNETAMAHACAVGSLSPDECASWRACCSAAVDCCESQLSEPRSDATAECPRTWDGFRCWEDTPTGEIASTSCPAFVAHSITTREYLNDVVVRSRPRANCYNKHDRMKRNTQDD